MRDSLQVCIIISSLGFTVFGLQANTLLSDTARDILSDTIPENPAVLHEAMAGETSVSDAEKKSITIKQVRELFTLLVASFSRLITLSFLMTINILPSC